MLSGKQITVRYGSRPVVDGLSFSLEPGQWMMLAGPNGAGKTTLIEAVTQGVPYTGTFLWEGRDMRTVRPGEIARSIAVLSQRNSMNYAYTVEEVVGLGRYAHQRGLFGAGDAEGRELVEQALAVTGLTELRRASTLTLSGGETQRVFLAQVFAQNPRLLILDEPANHLDLQYQQSVFDTIRRWLEQPGRAVLSVVHDLSLARRYGTHALLMNNGRAVSQGEISRVLNREDLLRVYGLDVFAWMRESAALWADPE